MSPQPPGPQTTKAVNDVIEYGGKAAVSLTAVYAFVALIAKPFLTWRKNHKIELRRREADLIRDILKEDLARLSGVCDREEEIMTAQREMLARQAQIFNDTDRLIDVALDNRDRLDEMNELMDELGLASRDRRERELVNDTVLKHLAERRRARRRMLETEGPELDPTLHEEIT